ncbi:MAG: right-handed parallel beta-helix repeat-containing protein [Candidatus Electrothrix sp. YB6]
MSTYADRYFFSLFPVHVILFILFFFLAFSALCTFPADAGAGIIRVPDDYPSINAAIAAAKEKDTIRVATGEYQERVGMRPGITLEGGWNRSFTERDTVQYVSLISGSGMGGFAVRAADNAVIDGFAITGGKAPMIAPNAAIGPGIYCDSITFTVKNSFITGNNAAGIYSRTCNLTVLSNTIAANGQAGIFFEKNSSVIIKGNWISYNQTAGVNAGGGELSKADISNNFFHNNQWAGINVSWATGEVRNNVVYENGKAGIRCGAIPMLIANNTITANKMAGISVREAAGDSTDAAIVTQAPLIDSPVIQNNIIARNGRAGILSTGTGYSYNLLFENNQTVAFHPDFLWYIRLQFGGYGDALSLEKDKNILADPLFVNPAEHDYHLRPGSPAIDAGDPDVQFHDRNFGPSLGATTNDIGAFGGPFTITEPRQPNFAPEAKITLQDDKALYVGDKIDLSGKPSSDPNGDEISYHWSLLTKPAGSRATLSGENKEQCTLRGDKKGIYLVRLAVVDRWGMQDFSQPMTVVVEEDRPPTAKISKPMGPVNLGETVKLSAYDKKKQNGNELTFAWQLIRRPEGSQAALADPGTARPFFIPDTPGCYSVRLTVDNGRKQSEPHTLHICSRQSRIPGQRIVPDEYPTIQSALDAAEPRDTILVRGGTYKEKIIIDKAVDLIGQDWPVIDGGGEENNDATVFICYLDNTASGKMQGFVVTGGGAGIYGHGIQILNSSPEIFNNRIRSNKHVGIGIHGHKRFTEKTRIHENVIADNMIGVSHGLGTYGHVYKNKIYNNKVTGIGVRGLAKPRLTNNTIYNNYVGIGIREEAYPQIEENDISGNTIGIAINPGAAEAVYAEQGAIQITRNNIHENQQSGIFIASLNKSEIDLQVNRITGNATESQENYRTGGAVIGFPYEASFAVLTEQNTIQRNNGQNIQYFKLESGLSDEAGSSDSRRPRM